MPFIPETQKNITSKGVSLNFKPEIKSTITPQTSISDTWVEKVPLLKSLSKFGATFGAEIGKQGIGLGQSFLKGSQFLSNKILGTQKDIYNPVISEAEKIKQGVFVKPFESERQTFSGKAGELFGVAAPFVATGGAVKTGQEFLSGLTKAESIAGSTKVVPYLVQKFAQVAPEAVVSGATELAVTGGDKDRAKTAAITAGLFTTLSHVGSDVYRQIIPQTVKANVLKSLGFTGRVSLKDVANGKKLDDGVGAFTTMSRLAPDIKVVDETGVEKVFDPTKADFIELPQALYQSKKKIYEEYTKLATQSGEQGAKFTARDFYTLIDDLKKYDKPGFTSAYSNKANQIISDIQRFIKIGERGQKFFGDTDLLEIQKLVESINKDVNPLSDRAGAEVAQEASKKLRDLLDSKIEASTGSQYQQLRDAYAQLKSIEPSVINAFKKAARGSKLSDFINGVSAVDVLEGIITQNPSSVVRGGLIKGVKEIIGKVNSPEAAMQRAFRLINKGADGAAGRFTGAVSGETAAFRAGQKTQEAIKDYVKNPKLGMSIEDVSKNAYKGEKDLTTKILKDLEGKTTVSKQYILDATNRGELKQVERDLIRNVLETEKGDTINVSDFAKKVKAELLPLKTQNLINPKYESITLPSELRGSVKNYSENIYESPIKTSAGNVHFPSYGANSRRAGTDSSQNYFGHTRIEDMADNNTRRVIEVQSDLYQKGNLENMVQPSQQEIDAVNSYYGLKGKDKYTLDKLPPKSDLGDIAKYGLEGGSTEQSVLKAGNKNLQKLAQYNDPTAHFRMIREEIKKAAEDGKTKLQFPTGETAMKIEGLGENVQFRELTRPGGGISRVIKPEDLTVGKEIFQGSDKWIITDVLGDGKFKAVEKRFIDNAEQRTKDILADGRRPISLERYEETFDISGKVDTNNPIYKFYERDMQKYLNKFGGKRIVDDKGVSWVEVPVKKEWAKAPVEAFAALPLFPLAGDKENKTQMNIERIKNEIAFREADKTIDNPYLSINKNNKDGSVDYGKYQVNESTLNHWSERFLGKKVTPDEFLNNPDLQEKFMENAIRHISKLGAKSLDAFLILWHKGWGDISSKRIAELKKDPEIKQYLNNKRK